jgi:serine/threonine protein kinase
LQALERLGIGGTAEIWTTADPLQRRVVLKTLRAELRAAGALHGLLEREARVLEAARHEHVVAVYGLIEFRGARALALEYLGGGDLVALVGAPVHTWIRAAADVVAALRHVHACGYAYRDLKARNVLFDAHDRVRLIDFGSAWPLGAAPPGGGTTAAYRPAAPWRVAGVREDELALAALLYELLTGRLPFGTNGERSRAALQPPLESARAYAAPVRALGDLVVATLRADPSSAVGSLSEFAAVIDTVIAGDP